MIAVTSKSFLNSAILMAEAKEAFGKITRDLDRARGAIIGLEPITVDTLSLCPDLRVISKYGVGLDNIDLEACQKRNVKVVHTPGINAKYVAEHTIGLMISLLRRIHQNSDLMRIGIWQKNGGTSLQGLKVGIIGVGHIGAHVASMIEPFGAKYYLNDLDPIGYAKGTIYRECDVITLHVPLTKETKYMISMHEFFQMKKNAILINTSRGAVVRMAALKEALRQKMIAGAAIDVFEDEPCLDRELMKHDNVICTPHTAGNSKQAVLAMGRAAIENLKCAL